MRKLAEGWKRQTIQEMVLQGCLFEKIVRHRTGYEVFDSGIQRQLAQCSHETRYKLIILVLPV